MPSWSNVTTCEPAKIERDGHSWLEAGAGEETIVFLHPIVGTSVYWEPQMQALSDRWRCVAWDAPGYGGTAPVSEPLAPSVTASLLDFFDVAEIERAHVVGLSLGAMFALHAATGDHGRFDRLVLADTSAAFGIDPDDWLDDWLGGLRSGTALPAVVDDSIDAITSIAPEQDLRNRIVASFGDVPHGAFETASRYIAFHNVAAELASITQQTLVLVGEHDGETPPEYARAIADGLANATFHQIPGVGHLSSLEAPEVFSDLVRSFVAR